MMLRKLLINLFAGEKTDKPYIPATYYGSNSERVTFTFNLNPVVGGITSQQFQAGNMGMAWCNFNLFYFFTESKKQIAMLDFVNVPLKAGMVDDVHQLKSLMRLSKYFLKSALDILPFSFNPSSIISPKYKSSRFFPVITLEVFLYFLISLAAKVASRWFLNRAIRTVIDSFAAKIQDLKNSTRYVSRRMKWIFLIFLISVRCSGKSLGRRRKEFGVLPSEYHVEKS